MTQVLRPEALPPETRFGAESPSGLKWLPRKDPAPSMRPPLFTQIVWLSPSSESPLAYLSRPSSGLLWSLGGDKFVISGIANCVEGSPVQRKALRASRRAKLDQLQRRGGM